MIPLGYIPLHEAASRIEVPEVIFDAARYFELHLFTWGNDGIVMVDPLILTPSNGARFRPDRSAATGRLEFELERPSPWKTNTQPFICHGHGWPVFLDRREFEAWNNPSAHKGGRPSEYDWPEIEKAFMDRVSEMGAPDMTNVDGWRTQADVARWIQSVATRNGGKEPGDTVAKAQAKSFMRKAISRSETN